MDYSFSIPGADQPAQTPANRVGSQLIEFFDFPEPRPFLSEKEGRPIFESVTYIRITKIGGKDVVEREARPADFAQFPQQYSAYKLGQEAPVMGTPIEQWPQLNVSQVAELKALRIRTVEQLAEVSDAELDKLGLGARTLRETAINFIKAAKDGAVVAKLTKDNKRLQDQIDALQKEIEGIQARVDKTAKS